MPSGPGPTLRAGDAEVWREGGGAQARGDPHDRGGGRVVRVPRRHARPGGSPLPRDRTLGLEPPAAAPPGDQGASRAAPRGRIGTAPRPPSGPLLRWATNVPIHV